MHSIRIILLCIVAAVAYGMVHDQFTARICVEYFTVAHPLVFNTNDPTLLGIGWGIAATWWVGLVLGVALAIVAQAGQRPKRSAGSLLRPVAWLLVVMAGCALAAGILGWVLARNGTVLLTGRLAENIPSTRHADFVADLFAHSASYIVGFAGGIVILFLVWYARSRTLTSGREPNRQTPHVQEKENPR
jgi:hypothetical protein